MNSRKKHKRRIPNHVTTPLVQPENINLTWSIDFMEDRMENGRKVRILNIIDDFNREAITMEIDYSFTFNRVPEFVKQAIEWRGKPQNIRTDNGTEFTAHVFEKYCKENEIDLIHIPKGNRLSIEYHFFLAMPFVK